MKTAMMYSSKRKQHSHLIDVSTERTKQMMELAEILCCMTEKKSNSEDCRCKDTIRETEKTEQRNR